MEGNVFLMDLRIEHCLTLNASVCYYSNHEIVTRVLLQPRHQLLRDLLATVSSQDLLQLNSSFIQWQDVKVSFIRSNFVNININVDDMTGLVDTAVKTAETGYMQRRLVKVLMFT